jgi:hypothetical protein
MLESLKRNNFLALLFCLPLSLVLWLPRLICAADISVDITHQGVVLPLTSLYENVPGAWLMWLAFLLTCLNTFGLMLLYNRYTLHTTNSLLLPLLYVLLSAAIPVAQGFSYVQIEVLAVIIALYFLLPPPASRTGLGEVFMGTFWLSVACLFFPPGLAMLLVVPATLLLLRPFAWRDWAMFLTGAMAPFVYTFLYLRMAMRHTAGEIFMKLQAVLPEIPHGIIHSPLPVYLFYAALTIVLFIAIVRSSSRQTPSKISALRIRTVLCWMLLFVIAGIIFYPAYHYYIMPLLAVPAALLLADYFARPKSRKTKRFCWIILLAAILYLQIAEFL